MLSKIVSFKDYIIIGVVCLALGGAVAGVTTWQLTQNYYQAKAETVTANHNLALETLRRETAETVTGVTNEKVQLYKDLSETSHGLQNDFTKAVSGINSSVAELRNYRLSWAGQGVPAGGSGNLIGGNSAGTTGSDGSIAAQGILSAEASKWLLDGTAESDIILERLRTCQAWSNELDAKIKAHNAKIAEHNAAVEKAKQKGK